MKRSLKQLHGYKLKVKDGNKGTVKDFFFDEDSWTLRYMVTDLGGMFEENKVLIPRVFFDKPDWGFKEFLIHMTLDEIKRSPKLEKHQPVSRQYEELLNKFYRIDNYWSGAYAPSFGVPEMVIPNAEYHLPPKIIKEKDIDSYLRSFQEIKGYHVECLDKKKGYVSDFIFDDENWKIVYLIIDIGHWYTKDKKVMLAVNWISEINYENQGISINQSSTVLEEAPEFDPSMPVNIEYERNLYDYYGRKVVKV